MYAIQSYTAKSSIASIKDGYRRSIHTSKERKDKLADGSTKSYGKPASVYIDVPILKVSCTPQDLQPALQEAAYRLQDLTIRSHIMARYDWEAKQHKLHTIMGNQCDIAAVVAYAAATGGGRLSAEAIETWYDSFAVLPLAKQIATKNDLPLDSEKVIDGIAAFRAHFATLASTRCSLPQSRAKQLLRILEVVQLSAIANCAEGEEPATDTMLETLEAKIKPFAADAQITQLDI